MHTIEEPAATAQPLAAEREWKRRDEESREERGDEEGEERREDGEEKRGKDWRGEKR